ncbi:MAG: hypothetical protein J5772_05945 [Clostridia bacterium]|nr:hypothetical protein [Clostridia bacterium]
MGETDTGKLIKRFAELNERAERTGIPQETKFLNIAEQSALLGMGVPCVLFGGYDGAERRVAAIGGGENAPEIACVSIRPAAKRFAEELGHRDFLGSVMALGVTREVLGDIIVRDNAGYLFCLPSIAPYIIENLKEVRRTSVRCEEAEPPGGAGDSAEEHVIVVASPRLDALIAAVYRIPREEAKSLCEKGLVYVNSRLVEKGGADVPENAAVSVRGRGRFRYIGTERTTKKGRLRVTVKY